MILSTILDKYFQLIQTSNLGQLKLLKEEVFCICEVFCNRIIINILNGRKSFFPVKTPNWGGYWRGSVKSITFRYLCLDSNRAWKNRLS